MNETPADIDTRLSISIAAVGFTSLVTQVVLLREFLSVFYGNELVIGALLANWMILTGAGAYLGRYVGTREHGLLPATLLSLAIIPYASVLGLRLLRNIIFQSGVMVGIIPILWSSFILLIPYCVLSGASFSLIAGFKNKLPHKGHVGSLYAWEAAGSAVGGLVFSLVLIHFLATFQILAALMAVNIAAAIFVVRDHRVARIVVWLLGVACLLPAVLLNVDTFTMRGLFPQQEVLLAEDTPYGSLTVTRQGGQKNFYENHILLASTNDVTSAEESVHYAMLQRDSVRSVLMVSGGITGAVSELMKYDLRNVDYVELNPYLLDLARSSSPALSDHRVVLHNVDPRVFARRARSMYDVILLNEPEPSTLQTNRYYTLEFFRDLKGLMHPRGILSLALLPSTEYPSEEARNVNSTMMNTLKAIFKRVLIIPGLRTYFLASDDSLDIHIGRLAALRGIGNTYVNQYYLDDEALARRSEHLQSSLIGSAPLNRDLSPVAYYRQVEHWLRYFRSNLWLVSGIALVFLLFAGFQMNAVSVGIFSAGFAASSMEVLLLIAFQIYYGYVYEILGIIVAIFMAGMAAGSFGRSRVFPRATFRLYAGMQLAIGLYCFLLPLALIVLQRLEGSAMAVHVSIFFLTFIIAALVGLEFSVAAEVRSGQPRRVASELYGVDLIGSALGALLVALVLIPLLGFTAASIVPGMLSCLTALVALIRRSSIESVAG